MLQSIFEIDSRRRTPKYLQIVHSVTKSLKRGRLKNGDRLLSINEMSHEFQLARDTVQKAYDILEKDGLLIPVRGKGFYIRGSSQLPRQPLSVASIQRDVSVELLAVLDPISVLLEKYRRFVFVCSQLPPYLGRVEAGLRHLCNRHQLTYQSCEGIGRSTRLLSNTVYLLTDERDLVNVIRKCCARPLRPGNNIGIISFNETPLKELLLDGITVISTDPYRLAEVISGEAASASDGTVNPFSLIVRKSL